jgi:hypothetical protein
VAQAAEVIRPDRLGGLDLDADHGADRTLQHHVANLPIAACAICR